MTILLNFEMLIAQPDDVIAQCVDRLNFTMAQCTMGQAIKELVNLELAKGMTSAQIFLELNYFRQKYLDACSLSVSLSIDIWGRVENS